MATVVYPGTFDPITKGHEDLVRRAARLFDRVVIGVADSRGKNPLFSPEERIEVAREALADVPGVEVVRFSGLLVHFAASCQAQGILRGVRSVTDFDYEFQLAGMNRHLDATLETIFMTPGAEYQYVSSTLVREISLMGGEISRFVSPAVERALRAKVASLQKQA